MCHNPVIISLDKSPYELLLSVRRCRTQSRTGPSGCDRCATHSWRSHSRQSWPTGSPPAGAAARQPIAGIHRGDIPRAAGHRLAYHRSIGVYLADGVAGAAQAADPRLDQAGLTLNWPALRVSHSRGVGGVVVGVIGETCRNIRQPAQGALLAAPANSAVNAAVGDLCQGGIGRQRSAAGAA